MQGGGRSLPQNLAQGGKTFGLNWLECLNSDGLPSLNSKFKDLNLQLHASTTVTNPYTFNIRGNCSFSTSIESAIPDTNTLLGSNHSVTNDTNYFISVSVTIPNGVNVILVQGTGDVFLHHIDQYDAELVIGRVNDSGRVAKTYSTGNGVSYSYVKVTPGKVYNIGLYGSDPNDNDMPKFNLYLEVYYSKTINNTTPTVTDL